MPTSFLTGLCQGAGLILVLAVAEFARRAICNAIHRRDVNMINSYEHARSQAAHAEEEPAPAQVGFHSTMGDSEC